MSSYIKTVDENAPAHTLPYETMRDLSRVLDAGDTWIELATRMPDITTQDVEGCRQFNSTHRGSPSEYLLRIWASKGFSILSLYNLFAITRMVRCMRIIHHLLPECHHYLEDYNFSVDTWDPCYLNFNEKQSQWRHVSPKVQKNEYVENASPLDSIGSCSRSWVESPTSEPTSAGIVSDPIWSVLQSTLTVPYTDLQEATSNFSDENVIGRGGYGVVYVGEWKHTKIAVKRFMTSGTKCGQMQCERLRQSLQELRTLAKFRHDNILPLYAFSLEGPEPCLVYQFMSNGSLEDRLLCRRNTPPLSWMQKREIAEGTARGLHFLHSISCVPIIHGDVKSANILLGKHFEPKLGDFGLSRDGRVETDADENSPLIASHVKGTLAYLPPEFIINKILSTKIDVYSFGIVLLEVATGLRAFSDSRTPSNLTDYCLSIKNCQKSIFLQTSELADVLMDKRTPSVNNQDSVISWFNGIVRLGLECANRDRLLRPSFPEIVKSLSNLPCFE